MQSSHGSVMGTKRYEIQPTPGDSIRDLVIPKRWRSLLNPLKGVT